MDYPFTDDIMRYDITQHKYVLCQNYVYSIMGIDITDLQTGGDNNNTTIVTRFLRSISQTVYNYIYAHAWDTVTMEFILAKFPSVRQTIEDMLTAQLMYDMQNGMLGGLSGVNIKNGTIMDLKLLRGRARVAPDVEQLAEQTVLETGVPLTFCGRYSFYPTVVRGDY